MSTNSLQGMALTARALENIGDLGDVLIVARELRGQHRGERDLLEKLKTCLPSCTRSTDYADAFAEYRECARGLAVNLCTLRFHDRTDAELPFQLRQENLSIGDDAAEGRRWLVEVETALLGALWRCLEAHEAEPNRSRRVRHLPAGREGPHTPHGEAREHEKRGRLSGALAL